jgi:hypothetical protein
MDEQLDPYDPVNLKLEHLPTPKEGKALPRGRHRTYMPSVPWPWFTVAATLPGKSLHVALMIWRQAKLKRRMAVPLPNKVLHSIGVRLGAKRHALKVLEQAGLIRVDYAKCSSPIVTVILPSAEATILGGGDLGNLGGG